MRAMTVIPGQPDSAELTELPEPEPKDGELLVEPLYLGVCGTDREILDGAHGEPPPGHERLVLGHELLGRVKEGGAASRRASSWPASSAGPTRCRASAAPRASGTCAATTSTPSAASRRSTATARSS